jgi:hypothetical protein
MKSLPTVTCPTCSKKRHTYEPCIDCHGSKLPGRQRCVTCFSYESTSTVTSGGYCRRLDTTIEGWWTGCMLHCPIQKGK